MNKSIKVVSDKDIVVTKSEQNYIRLEGDKCI